MNQDRDNKVAIIACGVLAPDIRHVAEQIGMTAEMVFLKGGLHDEPNKLRAALQEKIDELSAEDTYQRIIIGYGICGRGTIGIAARNTPLVIPRVHDCIALLLGSDAEYKKQFRSYPGTYYISPGWMIEKVQPASQDEKISAWDAMRDMDQLEKTHGPEKAQHVTDFLNSWKKNYQRAAYINSPGKNQKHACDHAKQMADQFGWLFEELPGSSRMFVKMLTAAESDADLLVVPPHCVTEYDPLEEKLNALLESEKSSRWLRDQKRVFEQESPDEKPVTIGLGIDAGGTFTDVVIYDFHTKSVVESAKALTTPWDFGQGIEAALVQLSDENRRRVELVGISTTLATNAIVEGRGQNVGLLVMPPYGLYDPAQFDHNPKALIEGRMDIDGREIAPIDPGQVIEAADRMIQKGGVRAFAVSGFASTVNLAHELEVKKILREHTQMPVTCGHELSEMLNFKTRATTAVLNTRIIPILENFLDRMAKTLGKLDIQAPIMVVKGDGTLMSLSVALERPVETILSGPAASAAGARALTNLENALVVDIGGTTTDTAALRNGAVRTCPTGTSVGGFHTHVQALDMRTKGLGGDSLLALFRGVLAIGPGRVVPACSAASKYPGYHHAQQWIKTRLDHYYADSRAMQIACLSQHTEPADLTGRDRAIIEALKERPRSLDELAHLTGAETYTLLGLKNLRDHNLIEISGPTLTDLLHVRGDFCKWDLDAAMTACGINATLSHFELDKFVEFAIERFQQALCEELLKKLLDEYIDPDAIEDEDAADKLIQLWLKPPAIKDIAVRFTASIPVIGIGAPVGHVLPDSVKRLETDVIIPPFAEVANALGAVCTQVCIQRHLRIRPDEDKGFVIEGLAGQVFSDFEDASEFAHERLVEQVKSDAMRSGTSCSTLEMVTNDDVITTARGTDLFLGRTVTAKVTGRPDLNLLKKLS